MSDRSIRAAVPVPGPWMCEPPYLMDDRHLADNREVIAEALETKRLQVNRAGNQQKAPARLDSPRSQT